jgi:hypothetical protein
MRLYIDFFSTKERLSALDNQDLSSAKFIMKCNFLSVINYDYDIVVISVKSIY